MVLQEDHHEGWDERNRSLPDPLPHFPAIPLPLNQQVPLQDHYQLSLLVWYHLSELPLHPLVILNPQKKERRAAAATKRWGPSLWS